jgi:hypothetical protein
MTPRRRVQHPIKFQRTKQNIVGTSGSLRYVAPTLTEISKISLKKKGKMRASFATISSVP